MEKINVLIADKEDISKTLIENYLSNLESLGEISQFTEIQEALENVQKDVPTIIIADISENAKEIFNIVSKVSVENQNVKFILISYNIYTNFIVDALRSGAKEFLGKPLIKEELQSSVEKIAEHFSDKKTTGSKGTIISAFSNKGGLGKTTVAVNLAKELADTTKEKVILVDLNMHLGDITAFLDIAPNYDIKYILENYNELNGEDFLLGTIEQYKIPNFYILADSPYRETIDEIKDSDILKLLKILRKTFSYIIIDNSSTIDNKTKTVCDESDLILLITTANLPALRNCQRCLNLFDKFGYTDSKLKIILNRYISNEDYKIEDVEEVLNKKIYWKIPNNYFTVIDAINKGITLQELSPASNVTQNYKELAQNIINRV